MKAREPSRLALAILERLLPESGPLEGDLVEEFQRRNSRIWLWWQVLAAIGTTLFNPSCEIRPLRLVELQPGDAVERSRRMMVRFQPVNLTGSPVHGVGGLGLVALSLLVTLVVPGAWMVMFASMIAGLLLGLVMIAIRRRSPA